MLLSGRLHAGRRQAAEECRNSGVASGASQPASYARRLNQTSIAGGRSREIMPGQQIKPDVDFVIIANDWAAGRDNPTSKHRIAHELARRGAKVLWVEGSGMRQPNLGSSSDRGRIWRKIRSALQGAHRDESLREGQIWVLAPPLLPLPHLAWVRSMNGFIARTWAAFSAWRLGFRRPALINYVPILAQAMQGWRGFKLYHCVDRWDAFGTYNSALMAEMDARCCRYADAVAATSEDLLKRCQRHNRNVALVLHGVDQAHFSRALESCDRPSEMPPGPVIGFFGLLSEWLDYPMILALAKAYPEAQVVLIGKADVDVDQLRDVANLHLLGPRPFRDLPLYIAHFTVGLIPFVINELTLAVNPIKLREMLAAGCPVVSTALPEVARFSGQSGVRVAHSQAEFIAQVGLGLAQPAGPEQRRAMSDAMREETWTQKVSDLLTLLPKYGT